MGTKTKSENSIRASEKARMEASNFAYRRALRAYHCHACNKEFKQMVNLNDLSDVKCNHCQSDFFEENKTYEEAVAQAAAPAQPQMQPQPQMRPQTAPRSRARAEPQIPQQHFVHQQQPQMYA